MTAPVYIAFASGSIHYDCAPCGRCCRGLGIATEPDHIEGSAALQRLTSFYDPANSRGPLRSFFTYADGCRYLADDNLCDLHREHGPAHKPRICRLFPFSRLLNVDGLWTLLPQGRCPWGPAVDGPSPLSAHPAVARELAGEDGALLEHLQPAPWPVHTSIPTATRRRLEETIRDATTHCALDGRATEPLAIMHRAQRQAHRATSSEPQDENLWIDMLRSAGEPAMLSETTERLFAVALPAMRVALLPHLPLSTIPTALGGFALWLRTLAELQTKDLTGEDLLSLLEHAIPLIRVLALAESPIPPLPEQAPYADLQPVWDELLDQVGHPLGEALLLALRPNERGAIGALMQLGRVWPSPPQS